MHLLLRASPWANSRDSASSSRRSKSSSPSFRSAGFLCYFRWQPWTSGILSGWSPLGYPSSLLRAGSSELLYSWSPFPRLAAVLQEERGALSAAQSTFSSPVVSHFIPWFWSSSLQLSTWLTPSHWELDCIWYLSLVVMSAYCWALTQIWASIALLLRDFWCFACTLLPVWGARHVHWSYLFQVLSCSESRPEYLT